MVDFLIHYCWFFFIDLICLLGYFRLAERYNIVDKPNERSSHKIPITRGGGIVFIVSFLVFSVFNNFPFPWLLLGVLVSGFISFVDDVKGVSNKLRIGVHLISIILFMYQANLYGNIWLILPLFILFIGIINAYNFMDGINGITGFYSLSILLPIFWIGNSPIIEEFIATIILSIVVFLYFNARKKAVCFAGDIGSICLAILVTFIVVITIIRTENYYYILTLFIYGIDSIFTIIQRLYNRENIFTAHRKHLYQYLANEFKIPHLWVSGTYGTLQIIFNFWLLNFDPPYEFVFLVVTVLIITYILLKRKLIKMIPLFNNR